MRIAFEVRKSVREQFTGNFGQGPGAACWVEVPILAWLLNLLELSLLDAVCRDPDQVEIVDLIVHLGRDLAHHRLEDGFGAEGADALCVAGDLLAIAALRPTLDYLRFERGAESAGVTVPAVADTTLRVALVAPTISMAVPAVLAVWVVPSRLMLAS